MNILNANEHKPDPHSATTVLITTLCLDCIESGARAPLKLGHYIHKKIVPIIANKSDSFVAAWLCSYFSICSIDGLEN